MPIDTSGFNLAIPQAPIVTPALQGLAPLQFSMPGMALKPVQIQQPSSAVAEGIASAMGAIGKGITAAYQNRREDEKLKSQQALARQEKEMAVNEQKLRLDETVRHDKKMESAAQERIDNVVPKSVRGQTPLIGAPEEETPAPVPEKTDSALDNEVLQGTLKNFGGPGQAPPENTGEGSIVNPTPGSITVPKKIEKENKILGSLIAPGIENTTASYNPLGINTDPRYLTASTEQGPTGLVNPATGSLLSEAAPVTADQIKLEDIGSFPMMGKGALAVTAPVEAAAPVEKNPSLEQYVNVEGPYTRDMAMKLQKYSESQGYGKPILKPDRANGGYTVDWAAAQQQLKTQQAVQQAASKKEEGQQKLSRLNQAGLMAEVKDYNADPMVQVMNKRPAQVINFMPVANQALSGKPGVSRRVTDLAAIDEFVTFARGTQPTEAQYGEIQNYTQGYLNDLRQKIDKGTEGARLSPDDINTMKNLMMETYNNTAMILNGEVGNLKTVVQKNHPELMGQQLPREYPILQTKSYYEQEASFADAAARRAHKRIESAAAGHDETAHAAATEEYNKQLERLKQANAKAKDLEGETMPANWEEWAKHGRGGWRRGMFGGVSDIGATETQSGDQ